MSKIIGVTVGTTINPNKLLHKTIAAVKTAEEMDAILANANDDTVGTFYMYIGQTTDKYENGAVYEVQADGV